MARYMYTTFKTGNDSDQSNALFPIFTPACTVGIRSNFFKGHILVCLTLPSTAYIVLVAAGVLTRVFCEPKAKPSMADNKREAAAFAAPPPRS